MNLNRIVKSHRDLLNKSIVKEMNRKKIPVVIKSVNVTLRNIKSIRFIVGGILG